MTKHAVNKVVLAYSGGLDTSIILKWLQETYGCEIVTFTADLGQGEDLAPARAKALAMGVKLENIYIDDLREEFVRDFVFPMFRANTLYEGQYLLGTSIARPLIAKRQIEIANLVGADAVCHGATGKGNDQVRFEVAYYALKPDVRVMAPWREWSFEGRPDLIAYAKQHNIQIAQGKEQAAPFSIDANLLHTSSEGLALEDPDLEVPDIVSKRADRRTITPEEAPDQAEVIIIAFERGDPIWVRSSPQRGEVSAKPTEGGRAGDVATAPSTVPSDRPPPPTPSPQGGGERMSATAILTELNRLGAKHGVGGLDLVENRYVGMKSRGYYETPGGTILWHAHRAIESITLDRGAMHLKDELMPRYASLIYNGFWWTPERLMLQAAIDASQESVSGEVKLKLYKGGVRVIGRASPNSLYSKALVGFDAAGGYNQKDAEGFIKLNALRLRILAERDKTRGKNE